MFEYIPQQLNEVKSQIAKFAEKSDRKAEAVRLVAVSKTFPAEAIKIAYEAGQRLFGENRVQELAAKSPGLPEDIQWHLIGHLQGNKAANAVKLAGMIESVDSEKLLRRIDLLAGDAGKIQKILLEINISGEASKFGETSDSAYRLAEIALESPNVKLAGLMTMAPYGADECELRNIFSGLRELRNNLEKQFSLSLPELSMGMSSDYRIAIEEGATIVRIGTAIFGKRN